MSPGSVFVPTGFDVSGLDEDQLRSDIADFINRYVELPENMVEIAVNYVLLSWVFDKFDELPYLAFRSAHAGRGKSRALEIVGSLCYRPIVYGGGSTAAATIRLLNLFGGTLIADEFDQRNNSDLAAELTKIINQGFQENRPLLRCEGDKNTPKPCHVYGPKAFALRKGFADDASETRRISIRMTQRSRDDIPLSLPRVPSLTLKPLPCVIAYWRGDLPTMDASKVIPSLRTPDSNIERTKSAFRCSRLQNRMVANGLSKR